MAFIETDTDYQKPEVISLELAKKQLKIEAEDIEDDDLVDYYIESAIGYAESYTGTVIQKQRFIITAKDFEEIKTIKKQKLLEVESISYKDAEGETQVLPEDHYTLETVDKLENKLVFTKELPQVKPLSYDAVVIRIICGYEKVPKGIVQGILLLISDFYQYRSDRKKGFITSSHSLLSPYKISYALKSNNQ